MPFLDFKKQHHLERNSHAFVAQVVVWNLGKLASQARAEQRKTCPNMMPKKPVVNPCLTY